MNAETLYAVSVLNILVSWQARAWLHRVDMCTIGKLLWALGDDYLVVQKFKSKAPSAFMRRGAPKDFEMFCDKYPETRSLLRRYNSKQFSDVFWALMNRRMSGIGACEASVDELDALRRAIAEETKELPFVPTDYKEDEFAAGTFFAQRLVARLVKGGRYDAYATFIYDGMMSPVTRATVQFVNAPGIDIQLVMNNGRLQVDMIDNRRHMPLITDYTDVDSKDPNKCAEDVLAGLRALGC